MTTTPKRLRTRPIDDSLARFVRARMKETGTPGVAVGVWHKGRAFGSGFGITSIEAPDRVDEETLFQIGSTGKTYTATAVMRLVERGDVDLTTLLTHRLDGLDALPDALRMTMDKRSYGVLNPPQVHLPGSSA